MQPGDGGGGGGGGSLAAAEAASASSMKDSDDLPSPSSGSASLLPSQGEDSRTMRAGDRGGGGGGGGGGATEKIPTDPSNQISPSATPRDQIQLEGNQIALIDQNSEILVNLGTQAGADFVIRGENSIQGQQIPIDALIVEETIIQLITENRWDDLEDHLVKIIGIAEPLELHPMLFMHVRRSKLLYLLDTHKYDDAVSYCEKYIEAPFHQFTELDVDKLTFASVGYLKKEINFCMLCAEAKARTVHQHGNSEIMHHVICDYFRLNIPSKIRREEPPTKHKMWRFGIRDVTPAGNKKASFRCMVCQHVFNHESIGKLEKHLKGCPLMDSIHLEQLFEASRSITSEVQYVARVPPKGRRRTLSTATPVQPQATSPAVNISVPHNSYLPTKECVLLYRENLAAARLIKSKIAEGSQDISWSTLLGTTLDNIEAYGNVIISALGPEVLAPPLVQPVDTGTQLAMSQLAYQVAPSAQSVETETQRRMSPSEPAAQASPSAQRVNLDNQLAEPQADQATSVSQTLQMHQGASVPSSARLVSVTNNVGHSLQARTNSVHGSHANGPVITDAATTENIQRDGPTS